ncbi:hypothetical protein KC614_00575 [candidate division WWE3 bacterium]|uniref:Uncharacterized protein n=1 Tax=candidate division WWE3 bacterium TaxID=2053526 RepID=A0A955LJL1_UNCKA|nr:hypothetical protein [candidate division WWE3 bacterium]
MVVSRTRTEVATDSSNTREVVAVHELQESTRELPKIGLEIEVPGITDR